MTWYWFVATVVAVLAGSGIRDLWRAWRCTAIEPPKPSVLSMPFMLVIALVGATAIIIVSVVLDYHPCCGCCDDTEYYPYRQVR